MLCFLLRLFSCSKKNLNSSVNYLKGEGSKKQCAMKGVLSFSSNSKLIKPLHT